MKRVFFIVCVMAYCMLFAKAEGVVGTSRTVTVSSSSTNNIPVSSYAVPEGESGCTIPVSGLSSGVYQVTLVSDGKTLDSRKISIRK